MSNAYISITVVVSADKFGSYSAPRTKRDIQFNIPTDAASDVDYTAIIRRLVAQASLEYDEMPTPKEETEDDDQA